MRRTMTAALDRRPGLDSALRAMLGEDDVPEFVSAQWVADRFDLHATTVLHAARVGKLPSVQALDSHGAAVSYAIRPGDALLIWGHRLLRRGRAQT